jgi:hypothetical protein
MWTPLVTCPIGTSSSGQRGNRGRKRRRLTFPCRRLTHSPPRSADRQIRHVERLRRVGRVLAAKRQQIVKRNAELLFGVPAKVLLDEGGSETVKTGGHRRVGGEEIARSCDGQGDFEGLPVSSMKLAGAFQDGERRVPFIQVTDLRLEPERAEQPPSADPEQHFLLEAQFRPAPIELAGNPR